MHEFRGPAAGLICDSLCAFDLTVCETYGFCGDGVAQTAHETCDGTDLGTQTCVSLGYGPGGSLACVLGCILDDTGCILPETACNNLADDDGDGFADCTDPDCAAFTACDPETTTAFCIDGFDNDGDHLVDCADLDCLLQCPVTVMEWYNAQTFDLDFRRLTFTPRASPPGYTWTGTMHSSTAFPEPFGAGNGTYTALNLADNAGQWIDLPFNFTFFHASYSRMYVQSNLYLNFGTAVDQAIHDRAQFFAGPPRVAFFWDDYDTQTGRSGDDLHVNLYADRAVITANRINDKNLGAGYDWYTHAQVILRSSGVIEIVFLDCTNGGGIVGITPGGGCLDNGNVNFN